MPATTTTLRLAMNPAEVTIELTGRSAAGAPTDAPDVLVFLERTEPISTYSGCSVRRIIVANPSRNQNMPTPEALQAPMIGYVGGFSMLDRQASSNPWRYRPCRPGAIASRLMTT